MHDDWLHPLNGMPDDGRGYNELPMLRIAEDGEILPPQPNETQPPSRRRVQQGQSQASTPREIMWRVIVTRSPQRGPRGFHRPIAMGLVRSPGVRARGYDARVRTRGGAAGLP